MLVSYCDRLCLQPVVATTTLQQSPEAFRVASLLSHQQLFIDFLILDNSLPTHFFYVTLAQCLVRMHQSSAFSRGDVSTLVCHHHLALIASTDARRSASAAVYQPLDEPSCTTFLRP